jgi:cold shock protein
MGRYKDYDRGPKRGGYDDDQKSDNRASGVRPNFPSLSATQASGSVEAIVKWFNAEKGFGFVAVVGGSDAFVHIRQLEAAGHSSVPEGARVKVRIGQGQKGPEVTEVIEVEPSTAQVVEPSTAQVTSTPAGRSAPRSSSRQPGVEVTTECVGLVKMYNANKGFGFIGQDGGGKDVSSMRRTLERGGLSGLTEGQRVRMQIGQGQKGLEARSIKLLD